MDGQIVGFSATSLMFRQLHAKEKAICCGLPPWQMAFFYRMNLPKRFIMFPFGKHRPSGGRVSSR